jgi:hypothetical protein
MNSGVNRCIPATLILISLVLGMSGFFVYMLESDRHNVDQREPISGSTVGR